MQEPAYIETSSSEDECTFHINVLEVSSVKQPNTKVKICDTEIEMLVDTGTTLNILDESSYSKLRNCPAVNTTITKVFPYGAEISFNLVGRIYTNILSLSRQTSEMTEVYIVRGNYGTLLRYQTALKLDIIPVIKYIISDEILDEYSDRFEGIGTIKVLQLHIHTNESKAPVAQPHRRIPLYMKKRVEAELKGLEQIDIIEEIDGPTPGYFIVVAPSLQPRPI